MKLFLITFLFFFIGLVCHAQKELLIINRKDSTKQIKIPKGSVLIVKTLSKQKYSGTLVELKKYQIVLWNYSVTVDVDEIDYIKVVQEKGGLTLPPLGGIGYSSGKHLYFKVKDWRMVIKEG